VRRVVVVLVELSFDFEVAQIIKFLDI